MSLQQRKMLFFTGYWVLLLGILFPPLYLVAAAFLIYRLARGLRRPRPATPFDRQEFYTARARRIAKLL